MSIASFSTNNATFRQLMGNGLRYRVPRFQRDYSWTEIEWKELWDDVVATLEPRGASGHYLGFLVLQTEDNKTYEVVDGQQRLTTLTLLVLATIKGLLRLADQGHQADDNRRRAEQLRQSYIGFLDPVSLASKRKLELNRHADRFFQLYVVPLKELPTRNIRASEQLLRRAFEWFDERVRTRFLAAPPDGAALAGLVETFSDRLFFTTILVGDELDAYTVFETLNARGVRLSAVDLLKNRMFSTLDRAAAGDAELEALDERWDNLVERLGSESFADFLRASWNSRRPLARSTELFRAMGKELVSRDQVFHAIGNLEGDVEVYRALRQPDPGESPLDDGLAALKLLGVAQPYPLLLAGRRALDDDEFRKLVRACVVLTVRYQTICGLAPGDQESAFNAAAVALTKGELRNASDVVRSLRPIYPSDRAFEAAFAEATIVGRGGKRRVLRYLLCKLESHLEPGAKMDFEDRDFDLEHLLPRNAGDGWEAFPPESIDDYLWRLGNLSLLRAKENRELGNGTYVAKQAVYARSGFRLTREIAEHYETWTPEAVVRRQRWLAQQATAVWRLPQFDPQR